MKKLREKVSFLTKILLVIGLLISNLSSLSVVFAYEATGAIEISLVDDKLNIRNSYENPDIIDIYRSYLEHPLSHKSEKLLHTKYVDRSSILG